MSGFAAGTLVHTKDGLRPIEQIKVGDSVLSKHESGDGERAYRRVSQAFVHHDREVLFLSFGGLQPDGERRWARIVVTPEHPIWVQGKGWKEAKKVKPAYPFMRAEALNDLDARMQGNVRLFRSEVPGVAWAPISSAGNNLERPGFHFDVVTRTNVGSGKALMFDDVARTHRVKPEHLFKTTVYNIEVEDLHTYYVGEHGVWVHNKNSPMGRAGAPALMAHLPARESMSSLHNS